MGRVKDHFHDEICRRQQDDGWDDSDYWAEQQDRRLAMHMDDILINAVTAAALEAKRRCAEANVSRLRIDIEICGGTHDEVLSCRFKVGEHYDSANAEGNRLSEAVTEYLRRKGWTEKHAPLLIRGPEPEPLPPPEDKPVAGIDKDEPVF